ncbi:MAG: hypothetical protein ACE5GZ_08245 [Gammaproteobacteria bacterium]
MSFCTIELNDIEIRLGRGSKIVLRSPGYAVIDKDKIQLGDAALKLAHLNPRATYNRFWDNLSQDALQTPTKLYRHNADLAHAHLLMMHEQAGKPEQLLFAVPGSYSSEQLSLLLGIVGACPFTAIGLVDSAVASTAAVADTGTYQHIEIYLHQTVLTQLDVAGQVRRRSVEVIADTGLNTLYSTVAGLIADLFIQQSRFDPQHNAETEQALYDQLPRCLRTLHDNREVPLEIQYRGTTHQAKLHRDTLLESLDPVYRKITQRLSTAHSCLVGDRLAALPGLVELLHEHEVLKPETLFRGCEEHIQQIRSSGPALNFVTVLPAPANPTVSTATQLPEPAKSVAQGTDTVTHVLHGHRAYPLGKQPSYLSKEGAVVAAKDPHCPCSVVLQNNHPVLHTETGAPVFLNGQAVNRTAQLRPGDVVTFADSEASYTFIDVLERNGP